MTRSSFVLPLAFTILCMGGAVCLAATSPTWDPLTNLDPQAITLAGPIFDSTGNAWVAIADDTNLIAVQSNGTSGTWKEPHIIGPYPYSQIGRSVGVAVDHAGGFYVTWGSSTAANAPANLMWTKYTPTSGWQAPAVIYTNPFPFSRTFPVIDSTERFVVVFNATRISTGGSSSIASNPAQTSWGSVQTLYTSTTTASELSVVANKSGTTLALVQPLFSAGLKWSVFNSAIGQWNTLELIPNSDHVMSYGIDKPIPLAVDEAGNITFAEAITVFEPVICIAFVPIGCRLPVYKLGGFRYESGGWTETDLIKPTHAFFYLGDLGSTATSPTGVVLISLPVQVGDSEQIAVFRYTPQGGTANQAWDVEVADQYTNSSSFVPCQVAWFEFTEPVIVYGKGIIPQPPVLISSVYRNGAWGPGPAVPGTLTNANVVGFAVAPTGEALLLIEGGYVTFLRP